MLLCPHNWREKIRLSHNLSKACGSPMENPRYYKKIIFSMLLPLLCWSKKAGMMGIVIFFTDIYPCRKNYFQLIPLTKAKVLGLFPPVHLHSATRNYYQLSFKNFDRFFLCEQFCSYYYLSQERNRQLVTLYDTYAYIAPERSFQ